MAVYRLAVSGSDSNGTDRKFGDVCAVRPPGYKFCGVKCERGVDDLSERAFFGLLMDIPDGHPILQSVYGASRRYRYRIDFDKCGIGAPTQAKIRDRNQTSPDRRVFRVGGGVDKYKSKIAPFSALVEKDRFGPLPTM